MAATSSARLAAPLIIESGDNVVAFGGFPGTIPVLNSAAIARLVDDGVLRFAIVGGDRWQRLRPTETDATQWIRSHGTPVDLDTIAAGLGDARFALFDLRRPATSGP